MLINLQKKQKEADAKKQLCEADERECNIKREEAGALKNDCQQDLDKVLPLLAAAAEALDKITKDDMTQLKSFNTPPASAAIVMEGMCYAFNRDQEVKWKPKEPGSMEKVQDFWEFSKKNMLKDTLIKEVKDFKEDKIKAIPATKIAKLKNFIQNPLFDKDKVLNASKAAYNLSLWIRAVVSTYDALLVVEPKREQLAAAEARLKEAEAILAEKKKALQEVMELLAQLESDYNKARREKEELEFKVNKVKVQLERAEKLTKGLSNEKDSWRKKANDFKVENLSVVGDSILCSGIIAYLGVFPMSYRDTATDAWRQILSQLNITYSNDFALQKILSDPLTIGRWTNAYKLPNDSFSVDNAIIL